MHHSVPNFYNEEINYFPVLVSPKSTLFFRIFFKVVVFSRNRMGRKERTDRYFNTSYALMYYIVLYYIILIIL